MLKISFNITLNYKAHYPKSEQNDILKILNTDN